MDRFHSWGCNLQLPRYTIRTVTYCILYTIRTVTYYILYMIRAVTYLAQNFIRSETYLARNFICSKTYLAWNFICSETYLAWNFICSKTFWAPKISCFNKFSNFLKFFFCIIVVWCCSMDCIRFCSIFKWRNSLSKKFFIAYVSSHPCLSTQKS